MYFVPLAFSFAQFSSTHFLFWFSLRRRILSFFKKTKMIDQDESPAELKKECFPTSRKFFAPPKKKIIRRYFFQNGFEDIFEKTILKYVIPFSNTPCTRKNVKTVKIAVYLYDVF